MKTTISGLFFAFLLFGLSSCADDDGGTDTPAEMPIACIDLDITGYEANVPISFGNCSENASSFEWDFGDGNTSTDVQPSHSYSSAGTYTVTLVAFNSDGEKQTTSVAVEIGNLVFKKLTIETAVFDKGSSYTISLEQQDGQGNRIASFDNFLTIDQNTVFPKTFFLDQIASGDKFLLRHVYSGNMVAYDLAASKSQVSNGELVFTSSNPSYSEVKATCEVVRE